MTEYYIIDNNGNQVGPISEVLFNNYGVTASTLVWCEGMPEWKHASEVPELRHLFGPSIPPTPPVTPPPYQEPQQNGNGWTPQPPTNNWQQPQQWGQPQQQWGQPQYEQPCPPTYLAWAIVVTLLCCIPFGVVAIIYASKVQSQWQQGDYIGAQRSSQQAKTWTIVAAASSLVIYALYFGLIFFARIY